MGWFSKLFDEKMEVEIGGEKKWVSKRKFDEIMDKAVADGSATLLPTCTVHVLGPTGTRTEGWVVGEHVSTEDYQRWKDGPGNIYLIEMYKNGEREIYFIKKEMWQRAKAALSSGASLQEIDWEMIFAGCTTTHNGNSV